ncbi:MAG: hypothetical protein HRU15_13120 [Planctomycetes bacterium]|nr:hypothetical protein [Planctomycetota bacterium]
MSVDNESNEYMGKMAALSDDIVKAHAQGDAEKVKAGIKELGEKMCAYTEGLEAAGHSRAQIQALIDPYGERMGAAFSCAGPPE